MSSTRTGFIANLVVHAAVILMTLEIVPLYGAFLSGLFEPVADALVMAQAAA